jgi:hypothetical protein
MLIVTETNGRTVVQFKKNWWPNQIGTNLPPKLRNYVDSHDAARIQRALLRRLK